MHVSTEGGDEKRKEGLIHLSSLWFSTYALKWNLVSLSINSEYYNFHCHVRWWWLSLKNIGAKLGEEVDVIGYWCFQEASILFLPYCDIIGYISCDCWWQIFRNLHVSFFNRVCMFWEKFFSNIFTHRWTMFCWTYRFHWIDPIISPVLVRLFVRSFICLFVH